MEKVLKSEDRQPVHYESVNPEKILERLGINNYHIDYPKRIVKIEHYEDWQRVVADLDAWLCKNSIAFYAAGWWWWQNNAYGK